VFSFFIIFLSFHIFLLEQGDRWWCQELRRFPLIPYPRVVGAWVLSVTAFAQEGFIQGAPDEHPDGAVLVVYIVGGWVTQRFGERFAEEIS
jgi:hypothetical protein